jgi:hypothetical protein
MICKDRIFYMDKTTLSNYKILHKTLLYFLSLMIPYIMRIKNPNRGVLPSLVHEAR